MGHNDHIDFDLYESIQDLLDESIIEETEDAAGIARQVIHQGYDTLTKKQKFVYDRDIIPALKERAEQIRLLEIKSSNPE